MNIVLLAGGPGSEREVSLQTGGNVVCGLQEAGSHGVTRMDINDEYFVLPAESDLVFKCIHGTFGENVRLQEILDLRGIRYTGEGAEASKVAFDKIISKQRIEQKDVAKLRHEVIKVRQRPALPVPLVNKATRSGSSVDVHLLRDASEIDPALAEVVQHGDDIAVEELISGHELIVGVLGDLALSVIMITPRQDFYGFKYKYPWLNPASVAGHFCPALLSRSFDRSCSKPRVGCSSCARIANLLPGRFASGRSLRTGSKYYSGHDRKQSTARGGPRGRYQSAPALRTHLATVARVIRKQMIFAVAAL